MKCPLISHYHWLPEGNMGFVVGKCLGRDCAWWHRSYSRCAVWTLAETVELPPRPITKAFLNKVLEHVKDGQITQAMLELGAAIDDRRPPSKQ